MMGEDSPLKEFYPVHFESDLNGKQHEWEAVVLIPFIDQARVCVCVCSQYSVVRDMQQSSPLMI